MNTQTLISGYPLLVCGVCLSSLLPFDGGGGDGLVCDLVVRSEQLTAAHLLFISES